MEMVLVKRWRKNDRLNGWKSLTLQEGPHSKHTALLSGPLVHDEQHDGDVNSVERQKWHAGYCLPKFGAVLIHLDPGSDDV